MHLVAGQQHMPMHQIDIQSADLEDRLAAALRASSEIPAIRITEQRRRRAADRYDEYGYGVPTVYGAPRSLCGCASRTCTMRFSCNTLKATF
jgi:hypothetical protein